MLKKRTIVLVTFSSILDDAKIIHVFEIGNINSNIGFTFPIICKIHNFMIVWLFLLFLASLFQLFVAMCSKQPRETCKISLFNLHG